MLSDAPGKGIAMKNGKEYVDSLKSLDTKVYLFGELLEKPTEHPMIQPHVNAVRMTYDLAQSPKYRDLATATSHLTGQTVNRFTHIHQSTDDLVKKVKLLRTLAQMTGTCFQRCVGLDALNAAYTVTYEMDGALDTGYHQRFCAFLRMLQQEDLMLAGSMTDPKGDRGLPPGAQADPDMHVRVTKRDDKGIVIRGAKMHMTGIVNSHWMLMMPTTALREGDEDYAVCCALPVDAPGVLHIFGRQTNDERRLTGGDIDVGNARFGIVGGEALTVLEDVFVPWEHVFLCGETQYAGQLVERFASYHRQNYGGCKGGVSDVVTGAAALLADYNGVPKASHLKDKLVEMILLTETLYSSALACSYEGKPTPSGAYYVDPLLANVGKQNVTRYIYEIDRLAQDIAGGFIATMPSDRDLQSSAVGGYVRKYLKGVDGVSAENRMRVARLLENMTGGTALVESMHGAGSPQAQRVMLARQANLEGKKVLAKNLAGVKDEEG